MDRADSIEKLEALLALPDADTRRDAGDNRAISLSEFVSDHVAPRESEPLPFPHAVRCLAWATPVLGLISLAVYAACGDVGPDSTFLLVGRGLLHSAMTFAHHSLVGIVACGAVVGASAALAAGTRLFRHGPAWTHVAAVVAAIVGFVLFIPVMAAAAVVVANVALWVVIAVVAAAAAIFIGYVLLMAAVDSLSG